MSDTWQYPLLEGPVTITEFPLTDHFISVDVISWFSSFLFLSLSRGHRLEDKDPVLFISVSRVTRIVSGLQGLRNSVLSSVCEKSSLLEKLEACLILLKYLLLRMFVIRK